MKVYVFGNRDYAPDAVVYGVVDEIKEILRQSGSSHLARSAQDDKPALKSLADLPITFMEVKPNEDLPFVGEDMVIIMDAVMGIDEVTVLTEKDLDKLEMPPRSSAHEFDLGWQLRYLKKLGKIEEVRIVGLPMGKRVEVGQVVEVLKGLM